ncbi:type III secretion system inner membrane ring lipoprotein SctJ [Variovorax sp. KK3]|uniref:type III secretion system inner membrane ring lipoprotein SctJ n=1 Tax=Variovorax sp. KK3 TaxID=1855728 RepID=UPI00097C7781|nr:type III secretion inner membrane ring lipoprotein SctJ [Variovorax sp. KK3]
MLFAIRPITSVIRLTSALVLCFLLSACDPDIELLSNVPESEVNAVVAALGDAQIDARKQAGKDGMASVVIAASKVSLAMATLQANGLPREAHSHMGQVFRKEGLISSPLEERARFLWALSQELSETVSQIDGVLKARVHLVLPERASGSTPALPSSAAVFIKHKPAYNLQSVIPQVKRLVSNSIPGLTEDRVTVVLVSAQRRESTATDTRVATAPVAAAPAAESTRIGNWRSIALGGAMLAASLLAALAFVFRHRFKLGKRTSAPAAPTGATVGGTGGTP